MRASSRLASPAATSTAPPEESLSTPRMMLFKFIGLSKRLSPKGGKPGPEDPQWAARLAAVYLRRGQGRSVERDEVSDTHRAQVEDVRPKVRNRDVQLAHAIVEVIGNRSIRTPGGERLQLKPDAKQPADGVSIEFLSDALSLDRQG